LIMDGPKLTIPWPGVHLRRSKNRDKVLTRRYSVGGIRWEVLDGRYSMGGTRWEVLDGRYSMGGIRWEVLDGRYSMGGTRWEVPENVISTYEFDYGWTQIDHSVARCTFMAFKK